MLFGRVLIFDDLVHGRISCTIYTYIVYHCAILLTKLMIYSTVNYTNILYIYDVC
jgi:hypothetical protein